MYARLYNLWFVDQRTRTRLYVWSIAAAFGYGVVNNLVLGRPEGRVTWETLGLLCVIFFGVTLRYCIPTATKRQKARSDRSLLVGAAIGVVLLVILSVYILGGPQSFRYVYTPPKPTETSELSNIRATVQMAEAQRTILPPSQIAKYKDTLRAMSPSVGQYWATAAAIINYQSLVNQVNHQAPDPTQVAKPCYLENARNNVFRNDDFADCVFVLDNETLEHTTLRDSVVIYHGGSVTLADAKFVNCRFVLDFTDREIPARTDLLLTLLASPNQRDVQISD